MKPSLFSFLASLVYLALSQSIFPAKVDFGFDDPFIIMAATTCGSILSPTFPESGDIPAFPRLGATAFITSSDTSACGTCWRLSQEGRDEPHTFVFMINPAAEGFLISGTAFDDLTGGDDDPIYVEATQVDNTFCNVLPGKN
ncbi:uncharacterized protein FOMMEDRAFT_26973 [Fomitiporia mediterranea MF3/22]|uniref:uncharacterized protein n=1 Tax=Fomitiporia mediterranea (strain MF3/22) TaxID=694068 RepID=UPI0004408D8D|nr:uncharacterized protein FOMMEDRAFT_26973 [Fomitiporia mediterranea MF3/22]EJD06252.1 hypothetical protein FOMMEDRAFT_26973 [Fomitiporia mediterranea MF3/22]